MLQNNFLLSVDVRQRLINPSYADDFKRNYTYVYKNL